MRRNGQLNQVEFLGLVHTFTTVSQHSQHFTPNLLKKVRIKMLLLQGKCYVSNYWSRYLINWSLALLGMSPRNLLHLPNCFSAGGARRLGTRLYEVQLAHAGSACCHSWSAMLLRCDMQGAIQTKLRTLTQWLAYLLIENDQWMKASVTISTPTEVSV